MNVIFAVLFLASAAVFLLHDAEAFLPAMLAGGERAAAVTLSLLASYCVWLGFFRVLEESGLAGMLARRLHPAAAKLFRSKDKEALSLACRNLAANLLGLPGAPTPPGVAAARRFFAAGESYAAEMLFVLNATSLQLVPATAIALRAAAGSAAPADIFLPTLIATVLSTLSAAALLRLASPRQRKRARRSPARGRATP